MKKHCAIFIFIFTEVSGLPLNTRCQFRLCDNARNNYFYCTVAWRMPGLKWSFVELVKPIKVLSCHRKATMIIIVAAKIGGRAWSRNEIIGYKDAFNLIDHAFSASSFPTVQNAILRLSGWLLNPRPMRYQGLNVERVRKCAVKETVTWTGAIWKRLLNDGSRKRSYPWAWRCRVKPPKCRHFSSLRLKRPASLS